MPDDLKQRQQAAEVVEKATLDFLMQFEPAERLTVGDAKVIARRAARLAFDAFSPPI